MKSSPAVMTLAAMIPLAGIAGAQTISTWSLAGDGNWKNAANWNTANYPDNGQPGPGDTYSAVLHMNHVVTLDGSVSIQGLTQSAGTITGAADKTLTIAGPLAWSGGSLGGGMTVQLNGSSTFSSTSNRELTGGTAFNNAGTMSWTAGNIGNNFGDFTFNNQATGVMNVNFTTSAQAMGALNGTKAIHNAGTLHIATATPSHYLDFQSPLHNSGLIDVTGSYIIWRGGGNTGQVRLAAGRTLQFSSNPFTQSGSGSITGAGHVQGVGANFAAIRFNQGTTFAVGSMLLQSGDLYFDNHASTGSLNLYDVGRLYGAGSLTATGLLTWTGNGGFPSYQTGIFDLDIIAQGGMLMNGNSHPLFGCHVQNQGAAIWSSGNMAFKETGGSADTRFTNAAGGTLDLQFDAQISGGGSPTTNHFVNSGIFTKSGGTGNSTFGVVVTNNAGGVMNINSGTLTAGVSFINDGEINVPTGASLAFLTDVPYTQGAGSLNLNGGTLTKPNGSIVINGGSIGGAGTINGNINATGLVRATGGLLLLNGEIFGQADVEIQPGASLIISGPEAYVGTLTHGGASLQMSGGILVHEDFVNANAGIGNAFDPRANMSSQIELEVVAAGNSSQAVAGTHVTGGGTTTPVLNLGTLRHGQSLSRSFTLNNPGTSGPVVRGALQTAVGGANITDARLSGSGVTPGNFALPAGASTAAFTVDFQATSGGPLTGQKIRLANNFDNVPDQIITLSGAAWGAAVSQVTSSNPIAFGNVRIGKVLTHVPIAIQNNAPADGWHEGLTVTPAFTNVQATGPGTITALAPQATDSSSIAVRIDTAVAGPVNGSVGLAFESDGTGTSGLTPNVPLPGQTLDVTGTVYALADPAVATDGVKFGAVRVGDAVPTFELEVSNAAGPYREGLNVSFDALTVPSGYQVAGSVSSLAPGASSTALQITMDTTTSGSRSSDALRVNLASDGVATGENPLAFNQAKMSLDGSVWQPAIPVIPGAPNVHLGNVRIGTTGELFVPVRNDAPDDGFSEELMGGFLTAADGDFSFSESFKSLPPQQQLDSSGLKVSFDTATVGPRSGQATIQFHSNGENTSGIPDLLPLSQPVLSLSAGVYRPAVGSTNGGQIIAYIRKGETDSVSGKIEVKNLAEADGYSERLIARISAAGPTLTVVDGESSLVDPEGGDASLEVTMSGLSSAELGPVSESVTLSYATTGAGAPPTSGLPEAPAGGQTVLIGVQVNSQADAILSKVSGPATFSYSDVTSAGSGNFGTVESTNGTQTLTVRLQNSIPGGDPMDKLKATLDTSSLAPFVLVPPVNYPADGLAKGASRNFSVTLDPAVLPVGPVSGTLVINQTSSNPTSDLILAPITLTFTAQIEFPPAYADWRALYMLEGADALIGSDPDGDGETNFEEFAFGGHPILPSSASSAYRGIVSIVDPSGTRFVLTLMVRAGDGSPFVSLPLATPPHCTATRDGIVYRILGSSDLFASPGGALSCVPEPQVFGFTGMPPVPGPEYEYLSFSLPPGLPRGFMRAEATPQTP